MLDACRRIWDSYRRKERSVYTEFLRTIFTGGGDGRVSLSNWEDYERTARAVVLLHPDIVSPDKLAPAERHGKRLELEPSPEPSPEPQLCPNPTVIVRQLKRHQIIEALRRPWPKRGLDHPGSASDASQLYPE